MGDTTDTGDRDLWVGLVHVKPRTGRDLLEGASGAYTTAVCLASDAGGFRIRVGIFFANLGFEVLEVDDLEPLTERRATHDVPQAILDAGTHAEASGEVEFDTYFTYD